MPTPLRTLAGAAVLLPALVAACGDDGGNGGGDGAASDTEQPYVDALVEDISDDEDFPGTEAQAECYGLRVIRVMGADELDDRGVTPEELADAGAIEDLDLDLPDDAADQISAALTDCFDDLATFLREGVAAEAGAGAECLTENVDEGALADALAESFVEGEDGDEALARAIFDDISPACAEQVLLSSGVEAGDITEETATCIADELDDDLSLRLLGAGMAGDEPDPEDLATLRDATLACQS